MKRWAEFERDRRWKSGTHSRDSTYEKKTDSNRYSLASNSDTFTPPSGGFDSSTMDSMNFNGGQRPRHDSNALLMLPAPLAVPRQPTSSATLIGAPRSSDENTYNSDISGSNLRLIPSPQSIDQYSDESRMSTGPRYRAPSPAVPYDTPVSRVPLSPNPRNSVGPVVFPEARDSRDPFRTSMASPTSYDDTIYSAETEDVNPGIRGAGRGVRLTDSGPVPGPEGVRRVSRPSGKRPTSQAPPQNRYSRSSTYNLPPGAAPPQPNYGGGD